MKLCVALDLAEKSDNLALARTLKSEDIWLKVGLRSFIRDGKPLLEELKAINPSFKIFLDLKLHDIPNTMADAAESIVALNVDMFNVHASSGKKAMQTVMQRVNTLANPPIVLAVTALTSFDNASFEAIYRTPIAQKAVDFATDAYESGIHGVVCSAYESLDIKAHTSEHFLTLTPGIRPFNEASNDQERVADLKVAEAQKSDFIVVGRPIYHHADPLSVVRKILESIA
ncbi:orotidine-5'-phosphate decarboxylase [Sulfurospirillum sp. hDNRA2]|jgi:orotidine-5'-phosphate decarboxylase|uniref:orotidine-5'-phosphate decarboxylase n=1 Tax=Sulfurospirillum sp. hDNRA2 TaxID=3237298 RepID=UPI0020B7CF67|nr:orotidine-5'-phosphate decarboxylase [Sulfurospirillum sp. DNRA8]MCP3653142.1 orotidine-5'-phosphate decarboxylase [Sulfurospirillum sp. DNRA8]MCR1811993.1 orotidine-5'-phosphate decarboxylase [Sulfurospirillum sp. DNRA8]